MLEISNFNNLSAVLAHLSILTGLPLSVYRDKGDIIMPPVIEDEFLSFIKESPKGKVEYSDFIKGCIEKVAHRSDTAVFKGPASQNYFFVPVRIDDLVFVIAGSVYVSSKEFEDFYIRDGQSYGLSLEQLQSWSRKVVIRDHVAIQETTRHIQSLLNFFIRCDYKGTINKKRYKSIKTILSLISDIELDKRADGLFDILSDILLFLFNVDSLSIMMEENGTFRPGKVAGGLKENLQSWQFSVTELISEAIRRQTPVYTDHVMEIFRMGLPDDVTSIHMFPIMSKGQVTAILGIFNSHISQEDVDTVFELCRIIGNILALTELHDIYIKRKKYLDILNTVTLRLGEVKDPEVLCDTIIDISTDLTDAERGSLMLLEDGTSYLTIKAVKGINKKLLRDKKIRAGEGIAGKVFKEGTSLLVHNIEKDEKFLLKRKPSYRTGSFISIPLKMGGRTIGVLNISDKITGEVFSEEDMTLLCSFASYATIALERSKYYSLVGYLKELSITDSLTGLFNRRYFEERLFEELKRSERYHLSFSLAMIDIDDFKLFNDTEGHLAGDEVLKNITNIAKESTRVIDIIARFGGEEFAVIMPQTEKEEAFLVADRIRKSVKEQLPRTWKTFPKEHLTITAGVASFPSDGRDMKELIRSADKALYKGKIEGKDRTTAYMK